VDFTAFVLSQLPDPPARVLEVGCGRGELALALDGRGYEVVAVDPEAPEGPIFRRVTIEELKEPRSFDRAVASFSLHHLSDLDRALAKLRGLLAPDGLVIVDEFGWDLLDETTAARYDLDRREWEEEHADLHGFRHLRDGLERCFSERHFSWEPYLSRHVALDEDEERRLIKVGEIPALGFRFLGSPR
jgi:ubiquinone/menaquinone biosynthesis C-methylase UbiE